MLKIFISTPMHDKSEEEIERRFFIISETVLSFCNLIDPSFKRSDLYVVDNLHHEGLDPDSGRVAHLGMSISKMDGADLVIFDIGCADSPGCIIEKSVCDEYGFKWLSWRKDDAETWYEMVEAIMTDVSN